MVAGALSPQVYYHFLCSNLASEQEHGRLYPTLTCIALDVLPSQASSVPTERLFSGGKVTIDDKCARLGCEKFEEIELMKFLWRKGLEDLAGNNTNVIEEVELVPFHDHLRADEDANKWDVVGGGFLDSDYEEQDMEAIEQCID